jgi:hypothetical protein
MSDNLRRYRAIRAALTLGYQSEPSGRLAQHLTTLATLISGIVGSKSSQLPSIAAKVADRAKPDTASNGCRDGSTIRMCWRRSIFYRMPTCS